MTRVPLLSVVVAGVSLALVGCGDASSAREAAVDGTAASEAPSGEGGATAAAVAGPGQGGDDADADAELPQEASSTTPEPAASGVVEATFDDIKFPMEKTERFERSMLTPKVESLFGKQIRIRGYMYPTLRKKGLTQFVLVRDNMECCFGPGAALFDCILVTMAPGETAEYSIRPIAVEGTFRLEELLGPDGRPLAIYQMVGQSVASGG